MPKITSASGIKTNWDLTKFFYKGPNDPQIQVDVKKADKLFSAFEKKYRNNTQYLKNETTLFNALTEYEKLSSLPITKPANYLHYAGDLDSSNEDIRSQSNLVSQQFNKISNKLVFFDVAISKVDTKLQKKFLASKKLAHFRYFLLKAFEVGKYVLSEPEEKILSLKSLTSRGMWTDLTDKLQNKLTIEHKGETLPLAKAFNLIKEQDTQEQRLELHKKYMTAIETVAEVAAAELTAVVTDKKINDELRGYKEPYDGTILSYENDRKSVLNMVKTVTDSFKVSHRFYKVKAKMLGVSKLYYSDRAAKVGTSEKKLTYTDSYETLCKVFNEVDGEFKDILERMATNGQIDAYPKKGKRGGAYCSHSTGQETLVLLNHVDSFDSHMTFAHEMGHAIHSEIATKSQSALYDGYSMSTAETASTLFESFAFYDALKTMNDAEKIAALHDKLQDDIQTIFRQIACFNFEVDMHKTIRTKGSLSKDEFATLMNKHMKSYLGEMFDLSPLDGMFFVN